MRLLRNSFFLFLLLFTTAAGQIPTAAHIAMLKAEDARRYDRAVEDRLRSPSEDVRRRAALAAGRIGNAAALPALASLLETDPSSRVREMAAFAIGEIESVKAADVILRATRDSVVRGRVIEAAGKIVAANPTDAKGAELRQAILDVLDDEKRGGSTLDRQVILLGLTAALRAAPRDAKRERPDATDITVARYLSHSDPRIRADAANTLTRVRAKNANDVLRRLIASDLDPIVRANAARALGAAEDKDAVDLIITAATADTRTR